MANIGAKKNKNIVELKKDLGNTSVEHVYVDGVNTGVVMGSVNEKDKQAALDSLQKALEAADGNIYKAMSMLSVIGNFKDKGVEPNEEVEVKGIKMIINYTNKCIYDLGGEVFATCEDLKTEMPNEAIKALLISRAENKLLEEESRDEACDYCDGYCEDCDEDCDENYSY